MDQLRSVGNKYKPVRSMMRIQGVMMSAMLSHCGGRYVRCFKKIYRLVTIDVFLFSKFAGESSDGI